LLVRRIPGKCSQEDFHDQADRAVASVAALHAWCTARTRPGRSRHEICTRGKPWSGGPVVLQSNVDFPQKTITKLGAYHQQKLDAANRQIDGLKSTVISLQKIVDDLQAVQKKAAGDQKKADTPPAKENAAPAKDGAK
jgi:hypothetical protein